MKKLYETKRVGRKTFKVGHFIAGYGEITIQVKGKQPLLVIWLKDLEDFTKAYCKHYKCKYESPKKLTLKIL